MLIYICALNLYISSSGNKYNAILSYIQEDHLMLISEFETKLKEGKFDSLATKLIKESEGCTEDEIYSNLNCFDSILHEWDQSSTLPSPFRVLDFRSIKERLAEALYMSANYKNLEKMPKENGINLSDRDFYINAAKECLYALSNN